MDSLAALRPTVRLHHDRSGDYYSPGSNLDLWDPDEKMSRMQSKFFSKTVVFLPVSVLGIAMAGGCQPAPPETPSVDVGSEISLERMQEYGAVAADKIVQELSSLPPAKDPTGPRRVIYLADLVNHTATPSGDFELFMKSLRAAWRIIKR